jgi:hypothetical protein
LEQIIQIFIIDNTAKDANQNQDIMERNKQSASKFKAKMFVLIIWHKAESGDITRPTITILIFSAAVNPAIL